MSGLVASKVVDLGIPSNDAEPRFIRVGTWPDQYEVKLKWNRALSKWIGDPKLLCQGIDISPTQTDNPNYGYLDIGGAQSGYTLRMVPFASALWNAGLRLQDQWYFRGWSASAGQIIHMATWWYEFNNGDYFLFANDAFQVPWPSGAGNNVYNPPGGTERYTLTTGSNVIPASGLFSLTVGFASGAFPATGTIKVAGYGTITYSGVDATHFLNCAGGTPGTVPAGTIVSSATPPMTDLSAYTKNIGRGQEVISDGTTGIKVYNTGWQNINFFLPNFDGSISATPTQPSKDILFPTPYAYREGPNYTSAAALANITDHGYQVRWVSQ